MDAIVRQALAKWPNVPHCYGWLGLDARGNWYMRDDKTQASGSFPMCRGSLLRHDKLVEFIHRNYEPDEVGCWYFQNGPQRVYVELEAAPLVLRLDGPDRVHTHTGHQAMARSCVVDDLGRLYLDTDRGFGVVHTQDMVLAVERLEAGYWSPVEVPFPELPSRFGFVLSPAHSESMKAGR